MKDWVYWMGFWFAIGVIVFVFFGIPFIAYLGFTRKLKFLPSLDDLLARYPNTLDDIEDRTPYNKLDFPTAMAVLYVELIVSDWLIVIVNAFKRTFKIKKR